VVMFLLSPMDVVKEDMKEAGVSAVDAKDGVRQGETG